MSDDTPSSIEVARFYRADKPEQINPRTALVAALDFFDHAPDAEKPTHIMVLIGKDPEGTLGASGTKFFSGRKLSPSCPNGTMP